MGPLLRIADGRYLPSLCVIWSSRATESNPRQGNVERPLLEDGERGGYGDQTGSLRVKPRAASLREQVTVLN